MEEMKISLDSDLVKDNLIANKVQPEVKTGYLYYNEYTRITTTYLYSGKSALVQELELKPLNDQVDWNAAPPWEKPKVTGGEADCKDDVVVFDQVEVMASHTSVPSTKGNSDCCRCHCTSRRRPSLDASDSDSSGEFILALPARSRRVSGLAARRGGRRLTFPRTSTPTPTTRVAQLIMSTGAGVSNDTYDQFFEDV